MFVKNCIACLSVAAIWAAGHISVNADEAKPEKPRLRVGTFDSRAVAVAYVASEGHGQKMKRMMEEHGKAKAAGDAATVKRLETAGKAAQHLRHLQGFGTASVADILEEIKDELPAIAKKAEVDLLVSKWELAWQAPGAETVDVTQAMIEPFKPSARTLKIVKQLQTQKPIPAAQLEKMKESE